MKDNILCIFIMLFVSVTFNANAQKSPQGQFSVKGVLVDSLSNEGEPYSTIRISLKSNPAKPVKLAVTDTNGKFSELCRKCKIFFCRILSCKCCKS